MLQEQGDGGMRFRIGKFALAIGVITTVIAGCGGGDPVASAPMPQRANAANPALANPLDAADVLMDVAEGRYSQYFPAHIASQSLPPFAYRFYPATGIYLGVVVTGGTQYPLGGVYVMGGAFGSSPTYVGMQSAFVNAVDLSFGGSDNGCYDLAAYDAAGKHTVVDSSFGSNPVRTRTVDTLYRGLTAFQGRQAAEVELTTTYAGVFGDDYKYYATRTGDGELTKYGSVDKLNSFSPTGLPTTTSTELTYAQPYVARYFKLAPGESAVETYSSNATATTTFTGTNAPPPTTSTTSRLVREIWTYVGRETLTLPAGTYDTCRFDVLTPASPPYGTAINTQWVIFGTGILVQTRSVFPNSTAAGTTAVGTSVTLNGQKL
jgi:hypothetical protein